MTYDPDRHNRRSIRLKGYDYAQAGAYFVTICTQDRECLFGEIAAGEMELSDAGRMVERWWTKLTKKFPLAEIGEFIVMPNHFHGIVMLVGAAPCGRPGRETVLEVPSGGRSQRHDQPGTGHPHGGAPTLGDLVDWFKTMTTNDYIRGVKQRGWVSFPGKLWQRNYHEHIIRNEDELSRIREYIVNNPLQWAVDRENPSVEARPASTPRRSKDEPWRV